jgi:hypothetical protein
MTEMVKPLRDMIPLRKYKGGGPLQWDPESIEAFEYCQQALGKLATLKVCCYMSVLTPLVD